MKLIGSRLRQLRSTRGWSQADLAAASGVSLRQITRLESGLSNPKPSTLRALAAGLNSEIAEIAQGHSQEEIEEIVAANSCSVCGSPLVARTFVDNEYGDEEFELFACGATKGYKERPCPRDASFPRIEDFTLEFVQEADGSWLCLPHGKTKPARSIELSYGRAASKELALKWVQRNYVQERYGSEEADRQYPYSSLLD
jgi:transcriptional regulator with XRE-family HTH domain